MDLAVMGVEHGPTSLNSYRSSLLRVGLTKDYEFYSGNLLDPIGISISRKGIGILKEGIGILRQSTCISRDDICVIAVKGEDAEADSLV